MTGYRDLARNHDFTVLWIGQTVSELGSRVSMFVFPLLAYQLTGSALAAAAAEALHLLGLVGTLLPAGVLADRMDRRRIMRAASGAGVLLYGSLAVAGIADALTLPHLMVVALLTGAGAGAFAPAETSAVRTVVPTEDLPTALSQHQARQHVATLLGAPLGGLLYGVTRWLPFAADAVSYALSFVLLGRIRTDLSAPTSDRPAAPRPPGHRRGAALHVVAAVLPGPADLGAAHQPGHQRAVLRRDPAAHRGRLPPGPDRPGRDRGRRLAASSARSPRPRSSSASPPAGSRSSPPGASCRCWSRSRCGTSRWSSPPRSGSACSSTRPATPASGPTGSRSPPTSCRAASSRRCSSSRCPRCRSPPSSPAPCSAGSAAGRRWPCSACSPPSWR